MESVRRISVPPIVEESFSFSEEDGGESMMRGGDDHGTYAGSVLIETPVAVTSGWNVEVTTKLINLPNNMCGARLDKSSSITQDSDFRACALDKAGLLGTETTNPFGTCSKTIHVSGPRAKKVRMIHQDSVATYGILCSASPGAAQRSVFSRPVFRASLLPQALIDGEIHLQLLKVEAKPRVFKFLLEGYPGKEYMASVAAADMSIEPRAPFMKEAAGPLFESEAQLPSRMLGLGIDTATHGVGSCIDATPPRTSPIGRTNETFGWEAASASQYDDYSAQGSFMGSDGMESFSAMADSAAHAETARKLNKIGAALVHMQQGDRTMRASLKMTINHLRQEVRRQGEVIRRMELRDIDGGTSDLFGGLTPSPMQASTESLVSEVMKVIDHRGYIKEDAPQPPLSSQNIDRLVRELKQGHLSKYVTHEELARFDYLPCSEAAGLMASNVDLPDQLGLRLSALEKEVIQPGGAFARMEGDLKSLQEKKKGSTVSAGPYTFKDAKSTQLWINTLTSGEDSDILRYLVDARQQLALMNVGQKTEAEILRDEANAKKAGYSCSAAAKVSTSFSIPYPESMFKKSDSEKDLAQGGIVFGTCFATADLFEGTFENLAKERLLTKLESNRSQYQVAIDTRYPPDQSKHAKTHAVCSHVLRQGYFQAVGFLESIIPFQRMMTGAALTQGDAWKKCLTYTKAIFSRIYEVRTVSSDRTPGSMLYGMLLSTELLAAFAALGWIRHPDISSALVVASLQKEGGAMKDALKNIGELKTQVGKNTTSIKTVDTNWKNLKSRNPNLTM